MTDKSRINTQDGAWVLGRPLYKYPIKLESLFGKAWRLANPEATKQDRIDMVERLHGSFTNFRKTNAMPHFKVTYVTPMFNLPNTKFLTFQACFIAYWEISTGFTKDSLLVQFFDHAAQLYMILEGYPITDEGHPPDNDEAKKWLTKHLDVVVREWDRLNYRIPKKVTNISC